MSRAGAVKVMVIRGHRYRRVSSGATVGAISVLREMWKKDGFAVVVKVSDETNGLDLYVRPVTKSAKARVAKWPGGF